MRREAQTLIVEHLASVAHERRRRQSTPQLHAAVQAVKHYQQLRFTHSYADLMRTERYGEAARFFLDELYGPADFSQRDAQFMRVVPSLVRMLPAELVQTLAILAELHAVSESLDSEMGHFAQETALTARDYIRAWQSTGQPAKRETQIALTLKVGAALDHYTHKPLLRHTLRMMRGPARAAGFGALQRFLETGFDAFKTMNGADEFLGQIGSRERALADSLFNADWAGRPGASAAKAKATAFALEHLPPD